jgi:uncharacterized membrane protein YjgN (DUF898 family)
VGDACPKCGFGDVGSERCLQCGVVIALYRTSLDKLRSGPPRAGAAAGASQSPPTPPAAVAVAARAPGPPGGLAIAPRTPPPPAASGPRRARFMGSGSALCGIHVVNVLLTLLTLGVYFFWAKVKVRAYLLSETEFEGDRFAYHGTGREMLVGFLKALVLFVPITLLNTLPDVLETSAVVRAAVVVGAYVVASIVVPMAMLGARRYRLSRTSWRGIRFSLRARTWDFVRLWTSSTLLVALTLGLYYPVWVTRRYEFMTRHMWFGSERFGFDGHGRQLLWPFVRMMVLLPFTLGLSWFWFAARRTRYCASHTTFAGARFASSVRALPLAWLTLSNAVLLLLTLGLAWPWLSVRSLRYTYANLTLVGPFAVDAVTQQAQPASVTGEGLAGFFDADLGLT